MFGDNLEDKRFILREVSAVAIGITIRNKLAEFSEHNEGIPVPCRFGHGVISFYVFHYIEKCIRKNSNGCCSENNLMIK